MRRATEVIFLSWLLYGPVTLAIAVFVPWSWTSGWIAGGLLITPVMWLAVWWWER